MCGWLIVPNTVNGPNELLSIKHSTTAGAEVGKLCSRALHV
jgi:hypothetical protein